MIFTAIFLVLLVSTGLGAPPASTAPPTSTAAPASTAASASSTGEDGTTAATTKAGPPAPPAPTTTAAPPTEGTTGATTESAGGMGICSGIMEMFNPCQYLCQAVNKCTGACNKGKCECKGTPPCIPEGLAIPIAGGGKGAKGPGGI